MFEKYIELKDCKTGMKVYSNGGWKCLPEGLVTILFDVDYGHYVQCNIDDVFCQQGMHRLRDFAIRGHVIGLFKIDEEI